MNRLHYGDNLKWLRDTEVFPDSSVNLVYLDAQPQADPFAKTEPEGAATRVDKQEKQEEML